jgi:LmbE family N-acetylglucosaminyl deacetylase
MTTVGNVPALFLLAHHDDEVFCAGHVWRAVRAGRPVGLLWATAGGLAPARRRLAEGATVRRLLNLPESLAVDLALPDQGAARHLAEIETAAEKLIAALVARSAATGAPSVELFAPAYEGGHPDHDAVNVVAARLGTRYSELTVYEFPLYRRTACWLTVQGPPPSMPATPNYAVLWLDDEALTLRRQFVRANASQALPSLLPLLELAAWAGRRRAEPARRLPAHAYSLPPAPRPLLYELYTRRRFPWFRKLAGAYLGNT